MAYYHTYRGSKSLPRKRPKSPVTLVPFRSANPGHLEEFAISTQHDFANESGAVNTMANGPSQLSPFRTRTMKEYDQQISELKKENFSLKLRIYLMEEKMQQKFSNVDHEDGGYKADIELKVELENLKHELANKQELLLTASKALESLEVQHRSEVQCLKLEAESEQNSLKQRIDELEKEKLGEEHAKHDLTRPSIELLRKAFSLADVTSSDGENPQASETNNLVALLQLRITELETEVIERTNEKETYRNNIKTLESTLETKNNYIKIQEQKLQKRMKTIEGFIKIVEDKEQECNHLAKKLQLKTEELKKLKEEMNISARTETLTVSTQCDSAVATDAAIDEFKSKLRSKDDDLENMQLHMIEKSGELMRTVEELDKMKTLVKELEERMELYKEDRKSLSCHLSRNKDEVLKLQAELKQRDDSIERIKNFLENVMLGNVELQLESVSSDETVTTLFQNLLKLGKLLQDVIVLSGKEVDTVYFEEQQFPDACDQLHHFDLIRESHQQKGALSLLSANLHLRKMVESIQSELTESLQNNKFIQEQLNEARQQIDIANQQIAVVSTSFFPTSVDKIIQCPDEVAVKDLNTVGSPEQVAEVKMNVMEKMKQYLVKMQKLNKSLLQKVDLQKSSSSIQNGNKYQELLTSLSKEINHLLSHVRNLDQFEGAKVDGVKKVCEEATLSSDLHDVNSFHTVADTSLVEAEKEIKRLEFLLSSTEGTVRMLSTKVKYYRNLLRLKEMLPLSTNMPSHFSDTNLMNKQFAENECAPLTLTLPANICISKNVSDRSNESMNEDSNRSPLPGSFSAPVTPIKGLSSIVYSFVDTIDRRHLDGLQEEVKMLKQCIQQKDSLLTSLQLDIDRYQTRSNLCDAACQTVAISFDCQQNDAAVADFQHGSTLKHIAESHHVGELLRIRLEELADFLERLLKFDENGLLDLSGLTAERLASIRECLEKSQELSCTLSQSLIALDNTVLLSGTSNQALAMGPNSQSSVSSSNEEDEGDGYATLVSSPVDGLVNKTASDTAQMKTPKSCSRSLQMEHSNSKEQLKSFDNYLLVLRPLNDAAEAKNDSVAAVNDELPTCSLTFGLQGSFLSSTNIGDAPPKKSTEAHHHSLSESDSWSEPDRGVSQQRIGLQSNQLTPNNKLSPRRRDLLTSSSTDSEFANSSGRLRYSKGADKRLSNSQELNLLNQVQELKEVNNSLHAELNLYQSLYNTKSGIGLRSSMSTTGKLSRRGRTKSGDSPISSAQLDTKSPNDKLDDYLYEISALRKQLESSIQGYDLLREQFEQQLAFGDGNHELSKDYDQITSSLYGRLEDYESRLSHKDAELCRIKNEKEHLLAEIQEMSEKFESYQETIESLQSMLEEQQRCSRDACRKVDHLEGLVVERDTALEESNVAHEQLQQAMTKARQLLCDNEGALKHLQEVNEELQNQCHQLKDEIARQHQRQEMVDTLNSHLDELRTNLEVSKKRIDAQNEDSAILQKRVEVMEHDLMVKEEEVKDLIQKIDSQNAIHYQELSDHQGLMAKMRMETSHLKVQLEAASTINKTLKTELQMYQKINSIPTNEEMRDKSDRFEKEVPQIMSEIRSLRVQLERSIEANQALRLQLEKKTREPLHLEIGVSDQRCSSVSSPETASSFSYAQNIVTASDHTFNGPSIDRQISKSSDYVSDNQKELNENAHNCVSEMVTDSASVYSSPDLGIESDRSRFSSLERSSTGSIPKGLGVSQKVEYLEPGIPGGGYWDIVNSAPPRMDGGRKQNFVSEVTKHHNFTCPEYGGNLQGISRLADSGDSTIGFATRKPYYITMQEDYGLLKKGMTESLNVLRVIRSKTKQHLLKLRNGTAPVDSSGEYVGWKEAYAGCNALKVLLQESCQLVGQFWIIPLPIIPTCIPESNNMSSRKEGDSLEAEIMKLYHELAKEKQRAEDALRQLEASNRLKAGMEKAIIKQLSKTHNVLKQAKGNLQQQHVQPASSLTTHK